MLRPLLSIGTVLLLSATGCAQRAIRLEAEQGKLVGTAVSTTRPAYSGAGYVIGMDREDDKIVFDDVRARPGLYDVTVRYSSPGGDKGFYLSVNGLRQSDWFVKTDDGFTTYKAGRFDLKAGANTVAIEKYWGNHDIDYIELTPAKPARAPRRPKGVPVDPDATPATKALLANLANQYGRGTLSGAYGEKDNAYIRQVSGKTPAIVGSDLMEYTPSRVERGADPKGESERLIALAARGAIITLSWHWNAPSGLIDKVVTDDAGKTVDRRWYKGFNTDATTFDVAAAMADPNGADYKLLVRDIDAMAVELRKFADANVPVLWRPLHEAEGRWFWWGAKGAEPYTALWRLVYDRLTNHHQLHNLIWVYTGGALPEWYPGDAYVDVVGLDMYPPDQRDPLIAWWNRFRDQYGDRKLLAISELGYVPDVAEMRRFGAHWSYFVTWGGYVQPPKMTEAEVVRRYTLPGVINGRPTSTGSDANAALGSND